MSTSSTFFFLFTILLVAVCTANLATGRASLRPSAGKRSVFVGRTPAHYYQLTPRRYEDDLTCSLNTLSVLNSRYQRLQEEMDEIVEVLKACETLRVTN